MKRETMEEEDREAGRSEDGRIRDRMGSDRGRARQGVRRPGRHLRPAARRFCAVAGATRIRSSPRSTSALLRACRSDELAEGHVSLWRTPARSQRGSGCSCRVSGGLLALVGFRAPADSPAGHGRVGCDVRANAKPFRDVGTRLPGEGASGMGRRTSRGGCSAGRTSKPDRGTAIRR